MQNRQSLVPRPLSLTTFFVVFISFTGLTRTALAANCTLPSTLQTAYSDAVKYKASCQRTLDSFNRSRVGGSSGPENIAVSDYTVAHPMMYILDTNGNCLYAKNVDFGSGGGKLTPQPSCKDESHSTPPGFHVIATDHTSAKYPPPQSLLMVGLEGQNSGDRHILIHPKQGTGTACTWGCSGVSDIEQVKSLLGGGSLVYNYFGDKGNSAPGCDKVGKNQACTPDHYDKAGAGSSSSPTAPSAGQRRAK